MPSLLTQRGCCKMKVLQQLFFTQFCGFYAVSLDVYSKIKMDSSYFRHSKADREVLLCLKGIFPPSKPTKLPLLWCMKQKITEKRPAAKLSFCNRPLNLVGRAGLGPKAHEFGPGRAKQANKEQTLFPCSCRPHSPTEDQGKSSQRWCPAYPLILFSQVRPGNPRCKKAPLGKFLHLK